MEVALLQAAPGLLRQLPDGSALALPSANLATLAQSSGWALRQHSIHSLQLASPMAPLGTALFRGGAQVGIENHT